MAGCSSYFVLQKHLIMSWSLLDVNMARYLAAQVLTLSEHRCTHHGIHVHGFRRWAFPIKIYQEVLNMQSHVILWWFKHSPFYFLDMFEAGTVLRRLHGCVWLKGCNQCRRSIWAMFQWLWFGEFHFTTKIHQPRWTTSKQAHPILGYFRCLGFRCVKWIDMWNFHKFPWKFEIRAVILDTNRK